MYMDRAIALAILVSELVETSSLDCFDATQQIEEVIAAETDEQVFARLI